MFLRYSGGVRVNEGAFGSIRAEPVGTRVSTVSAAFKAVKTGGRSLIMTTTIAKREAKAEYSEREQVKEQVTR